MAGDLNNTACRQIREKLERFRGRIRERNGQGMFDLTR